MGVLTIPTTEAEAQAGAQDGMAERLTLTGSLRNETAYRVIRPMTGFSKVLNVLSLEPRYAVQSNVIIAARIRAFYDAVHDLEDIDTVSPRRGPKSILTDNLTDAGQISGLTVQNVREAAIRKSDVELRELYLDIHAKRMDLRVGKQIVRWGVVEGARVTDEINALDFQEFILRDVVDRYIPAWMVKADYYFPTVSIEALWIPDLQFHKPAPRNTEWEQFQLLGDLQPPPTDYLGNPGQALSNSEWALKLSGLVGGWDLSVSHFYTWDDFPTAFRAVAGLGLFGVAPRVVFVPRYTRLRSWGATASKSIGRLVVNSEVAYVQGKFFATKFGNILEEIQRFQATLGETQKDFVKYALGLDGTIGGVDLSVEVLQQYIPRWDPRMIVPQSDTVYALFGRKELFNAVVTPQLLMLFFVTDNDWLLRPRVDYNVTDRVRIAFGADLLFGEIGGPLPGEFHFVGFFRNNSRVFCEVTYGF